jgi:hypothetical protein
MIIAASDGSLAIDLEPPSFPAPAVRPAPNIALAPAMQFAV